MKKFLLVFITALGMVSAVPPGYCSDALRVEAVLDVPSVFLSESFGVKARVVNVSSVDQTFELDTLGYDWHTDNPLVENEIYVAFLSHILLGKVLKPGESYEETLTLVIPKKEETGSVTFRLGFKPGGGPDRAWSDPITVNVQVIPALALQLGCFADKASVKLSEPFQVHMRLKNVGPSEQIFYVQKIPQVVNNSDWSMDNHFLRGTPPAIIYGRPLSSLKQMTLKPDETYEDEMGFIIDEKRKLGPEIFKIGFKPVGSPEAIWSNVLSIETVSDSPLLLIIGSHKKDSIGNQEGDLDLLIKNNSSGPVQFESGKYQIKVLNTASHCLEIVDEQSRWIELRPDEVYTKDLRLKDRCPTANGLRFQLGIQLVGSAEPIWSNAIGMKFPPYKSDAPPPPGGVFDVERH